MAYKKWIYIGEINVGDKVHVTKPVKMRMTLINGLFKKDSFKERLITPDEILIVTRIPASEAEDGGGVHTSYFPAYYYLKDKNDEPIWGIPERLLELIG